MTLGNISKDVRNRQNSHASVLVGYLPVTKLDCFKKPDRTKILADLFHYCMGRIVQPLEEAGRHGVYMGCADGQVRHCFPLLAAYIADNPEQCLIACVKNNSCHRCTVPVDQRGDYYTGSLRDPKRTVLDLSAKVIGVTTSTFDSNSLNPVDRPFWANLPFTDIFTCLTPDLLHQLHRGVFKDHLLQWCQSIIGKAEVDQRYRAQTGHPTLRHFADGISGLSQTTGKEHKNMEKVFAGVIHGADARLVRSATALLDFIYLASLPVHTDASIAALENTLKKFHQDKDVFIELGGRDQEHFNLNKLHSLLHYGESIRSRGSLDGYNTEWSERLHIDYAKKGYRASNHVNYTPQMTKWLTRREKIVFFRRYLEFAQAVPPAPPRDPGIEAVEGEDSKDNEDNEDSLEPVEASTQTGRSATSSDPTLEKDCIISATGTKYIVARSPAFPACTVSKLRTLFGCERFLENTQEFIRQQRLHYRLSESDTFDVYIRLNIFPPPPSGSYIQPRPQEAIRASPGSRPDREDSLFDAVLIHRPLSNVGDGVRPAGECLFVLCRSCVTHISI
jgi:hypothetical protein